MMFRPNRQFVSGLLATLLIASPAAAQSKFHGLHESVENWRPNKYLIICGDTSSLFNFFDDVSCIDEEAKDDYEFYLMLASQEFEWLRFHSPDGFGPVIEHPDSGERVVRIYAEALQDASANVGAVEEHPFAESCRPGAPRRMTVSPSAVENEPEFRIAALAAHELFHTVQGALPEGSKKNPHRYGECYPPYWINEGQSDAMAINFYRRYFPREFPVQYLEFRRKYAGLRPYHLPLYWKFGKSNKHLAYRTSSFWLHIGDRYRSGDFRYLQDYLTSAAPTYGGGKEDWLRWLDDRLREDAQVATPLYRVFPGFLTHFLGAHEKGGVGNRLGEHEWISSGFGGCEWAFVSPEEPYVELDLELYPMSGLCLSVMVTGLRPGQLASVKLAAHTTRRHVDSLHMGFAYTDDATGFNCGYAVRKHRLPRGKLECLLEPVTTSASDSQNLEEPAVRYWNGVLVEPGFQGGDPKAEPSEEGAGAFLGPFEQSQNAQALPDNWTGPANPNQTVTITNKYALSYVPPEPRLSELEGRAKVKIRIAVGLEAARLVVEGQDVDRGAADGRRASRRMRAVAAAGSTALSSNIIAPPSTGYVDDAGLAFGDTLSRQLAMIREMTSRAQDAAADATGGVAIGAGFRRFRLAEAEVTPVGGHPIEEKIEVLREFEIISSEPLPEGVTGTFDAAVQGIDRQRKRGFRSEDPQAVKLEVIENSYGGFRARVSGTICEGTLDPAEVAVRVQAGLPWCERRFQIAGEIIKSFAYAYRQGQTPVSRETPGEKLYNAYGPDGRFAGGGGPGPGTGPSAPTGSATGQGATGLGSAAQLCDCSCPIDLSLLDEACATQCAPQVAMCQVETGGGAATAMAERPITPGPPEPTLKAQRRWFSRLVSDQGLPPDVEAMLVDDFATMSDDTRAYLIRRYRHGVQ